MPKEWEILSNMHEAARLSGDVSFEDLNKQVAGLPFLLHRMEDVLSDLLGFVREIRNKSEEVKKLESLADTVLHCLEDEEKHLRSKWEHSGKEWDEWRYLTNIYCNVYKNAIAAGIRLKQDGAKLEPLIWLTLFFREWIRLPFVEELWRLHRQWLIENFAFDLGSSPRQIERIFKDEVLVQKLKDITNRMIELAQSASPAAARSVKKDIRKPKEKRRGGCNGGGGGVGDASKKGSRGGGEGEFQVTGDSIKPEGIETHKEIAVLEKNRGDSISIPQIPPTKEKNDEVDCTVFSPYAVAKGETLAINVFLHLPEQFKDAEEMVRKKNLKARSLETITLDKMIVIESELTIQFVIVELENINIEKILKWKRKPQRVPFYAQIPDTINNDVLTVLVNVSQYNKRIGEIMFQVNLIPKALAKTAGKLSEYQKLFLSYSSEDRPHVRICAQLLRMIGIRFFWDILNLEAGDLFEPKLYSFIDDCDAVLLFWSENAKKSEWVRREWMYTIENKGIDRLIPFILDGPPPVLPPPELSGMNMNDALVYIK